MFGEGTLLCAGSLFVLGLAAFVYAGLMFIDGYVFHRSRTFDSNVEFMGQEMERLKNERGY